MGGRTHNEDEFFAGDHVIAVADGVGGRPAGELAALLAVEGLQGVRSTADLARAVRKVNTEVRECGLDDPFKSGLASTLDAAVLSSDGGKPWIHGVHIGDGIGLLQRPGRSAADWLTHPHTLAAELFAAGAIDTTSQAREYPQGEALMRAVGFAEDIRADEWQEQAEEGQRYLLASDGLFRALGKNGLLDAVAELRDVDPTSCAEQLIERAIRTGADDNVTVVVADVVAKAPDEE